MDDSQPPDEAARPLPRILLVGCCVLAVVAAGVLLPAYASSGIAGSPLEQILPGDPGGAGSGTGGQGDGLGALNPGSSTGVGGEVGLDSETFASTSTAVHFVVESDQPTYWRTGSYDRYTGTGWEQTGDSTDYDGAIDHPGVAGERVEYDVTLEQTATAVPTAFRPRTVDGPDGLVVTDGGAVHAERPIESGTAIQGVSYLPQRDEELLRAVGTSYPGEIEQRYTQLPDDTPDRLQSLTSEITAGAETPYETAVTIQQWLRSEKSYNLGASEQSANVADTFVFEMGSGYCEYFATAMAAMLRSEGIPARYVVGYTTGQQTGENTYTVRGMNAHAWVEVYFPDVGWVRFDPTPGGERLQAYESALESDGQESNLQEVGSPGEVFEPGQVEGGSGGGTVVGESGYSTSLNRTAVPGVAVEVTVTRNDDPVANATVLFNDDPVGTTGADGTVVGTVPDADELQIEVLEPGRVAPMTTASAFEDGDTKWVDRSANASGNTATRRVTPLAGAGSTTASAGGSGRTVSASAGGSGRTVSASAGVSGRTASARVALGAAQNGTTIDGGVHPIERTASIQVTGEPRAGESIPILVRVGDVRLDDATVAVDGETVATTDDGEATVPLPAEPGDVTISVQRDSITGETTVTVPELQVSVDRGVALPGQTVTVVAELAGEPAEGAVVRLDGERVATTDGNGTATVTLPFEGSTSLTVSAAGQTEETTISGIIRNAVIVSVVVLGALVGLGFAGFRRRSALRSGLGAVPRLPAMLNRSLVGLLVDLATATDRSSDTVAASPTAQGAGATTTDQQGNVGRPNLGSLRVRLGRLLAGVRARLPGAANGTASRPASRQVTVREAWRRFVARLSLSEPETRTPGELADHAVEEDGLPEPAVHTLRDTFRAVEYGARSPASRLEPVQQALEQIEQADSEGDAVDDAGPAGDESDAEPAGNEPEARIAGDESDAGTADSTRGGEPDS